MPGERRHVDLTLRFYQEDGGWLGECLELGTATSAGTAADVIRELGDAVTLHLNGLDDIGELERVCRERGIRLYAGDT